ncbi:metal ABC transporter solute-binding protein, Zn/Mn family [Arthrobacter sp. H41]|uniref:metal ABC transporter solute-binding protein, Zn/Mn family n=1 Tax=Arthrobacter sp. H41 TaxID=1312978 RepID=UPI001C1E394E|nr:zinc ABC transporter substrate-binding protein [Arthrobacter sp. H41]
MATTNWHTDLARQIGGDHAEVTGLMGPGVDPHLYQASAGDIDALVGADMAVWNGLNLEANMEEVFEEVGTKVPVVAVGDAVPEDLLIAVEDVPGGEYDPHIWFDTEAWTYAAEAVAKAYQEVDPDNADGYQTRLEDFTAGLEGMDANINAMIEQVPEQSRVLVTSHDAFSYFARSYGLDVAAIQGKSTAGEATTADIRRVAGTIAEAELKTVFIESSVPRQTIDAVLAAAEEAGQPTEVGGELFGDSLGQPADGKGDYEGALMHNATVITEGLS